MAKKPTEKQLYKLKNEWLGQFFEEVKPKEFYRAVFPEGSFERKGHFEDGKANGITGTYRLCADKVVCKRVYEVERILLN